MLLETVRYLLAAYLLVVAVGAIFGLGPRLIGAPAHGFYSLVRLALTVVSLGRLRVAPAASRGGNRARSIRDSFRDWSEERRGERLMLTEEGSLAGGSLSWVSTSAAGPPPYPPAMSLAADQACEREMPQETFSDDGRPTLSPPPSGTDARGRPLIDIEPLDE